MDNGIVINLSSGYTVSIRPLSPYYLDFLDEVYPMPEFPKRKIVLLSGDTDYWPYDIPDVPPGPDDNDYELYMRCMTTMQKRREFETKRNRARRDYLYATCVNVVSGPVDFADDTWVHRLEAALDGYTVPIHPGGRYLAFLKSEVIRSTQDAELILSKAVYEEVQVQGIVNALRGFRSDMERSSNSGSDSKPRQSAGT